jgi:Putative zinc-finger
MSLSVPTSEGATPMTRLGRVQLPAPVDAVIDVWWLRQYAGGVFLPLRDGTAGESSYAQIRQELGVYVLGAIAPEDRARVSRHLASCPGCRDEVAGLAGLPALLRAVPADTVAQLSDQRPDDPPGPPEPVLDGLIGRVAAVRRRRRQALAAAAAVLAAAAAAGWAAQVLHPAGQPPRAAPAWWAAGGFNAATGARAAVRYAPQPWGTEVEASVSGTAPGTRCQIWAVTASGHQAAGGGWTVTRGGPHAWYPASVPFPAGSLAGFDITTGATVLVVIPLRPGTPPTPSNAAAARFQPVT